MFRPGKPYVADRGNLLVHLGFWALSASAEGFSGHDCHGQERKDKPSKEEPPVSQGVLQSAWKHIENANGGDVEILVVVHSLGGSVSWYVHPLHDIISSVDY
jgi:hypothetical protein